MFALCAPAAVGIETAGAARITIRSPSAYSVTTSGTKPPPLVNADDELAGFLEQAEGLVKKGSFADAIQILQALIERPDSGFVAAADGRQYVALWQKANEVLGKMGPKGLELYHRLYDAQAQKLFEQASGIQDAPALRRLAQQYYHSTYGPKALASLGAIHFDRGEFARAALYWRKVVQLADDDGSRALMLAKASVALHLAGRADDAKAAADELKKRFPNAAGRVGGREQHLAAFVARAHRLPVPPRRAGAGSRRPAESGWGGLGSVPDGMAVMGECDVVLTPRWRVPGDMPVGPIDIRSRLIAMRDIMTNYPHGSYWPLPKPRKGHVYVEYVNRAGRSTPGARGFFLPAAIHPVVVGNLVICRQDDAVVAYELEMSGGGGRRQAWATFNLPMFRPGGKVRRRYYRGSGSSGISDDGRYALTTDGDRVYCLAGFRPRFNYQGSARRGIRVIAVPRLAAAARGAGGGMSSVLAAISISGQGKLVWTAGGASDDDVVSRGMFLSAPTLADGRLYTVVLFRETYYLVCLSADTGRLIWRSSISQAPAMAASYRTYNQHFLERGSQVGVADGMAFVTTNAGVIAAFEAESGAAVWAYQYDSNVNVAQSRHGSIIQQPGQPAANPIIVSRGRVICLPSDSTKLIVLSVVDGRPVMAFPGRSNQSVLSAIDEERVLLSGPGLVVVSTETGRQLYSADLGIVGRPVVTPETILASGQGELIRMSLKDYSYRRFGFASGDCLLGNLVCVDGKLIAANASGLCVYASYASAFKGLSGRIDRQDAPGRIRLTFERGQLSFNARQLTRALGDFKTALHLAEEAGDVGIAWQVRSWLYRTHVAAGNHAASAEQMREHFEAAMAFARTDQEQARIKMRLARCMELQAKAFDAAARAKEAEGDKQGAKKLRKKKAESLMRAVALAGEIASSYGDEELPDLRVGPAAADSVRDKESTSLMTGRKWAHEVFIKKLLAEHGRDCYAALDAQAGEALRKAIAENDVDAMLEVPQRWPSSLWAPQALYEAGALLYRKATANADRPDETLLLRASGHLASAAAGTDDPRLAVSALAGTAFIHHSRGMKTYARIVCRDLRRRCARGGIALSETIEFAGTSAALADLLKRFEEDAPAPSVVTRRAAKLSVDRPLVEKFTIKNVGVGAYIVRDQEYRPVRQGTNILVLNDGKAVWLNTAAKSGADAVVWSTTRLFAMTPSLANYMYAPGYGVVGSLAGDGKTVVLADRAGVTGIDVATGKAKWRHHMRDWGVSSFQCMGVGEGVLVVLDSGGLVVCADLADGKLLWRAKVVGGRRQPAGPPRVAGGMVLVQSNTRRMLTCFDAGSGGRLLGKWAGLVADGRVTDEGLLAVMVDAKLAVYDKGRMDRPLWVKEYNSSHRPMLLSAGGGRIVVSEGVTSGWLDIWSVVGGQRISRVKVQASIGTSVCVGAASSAGKYLYVTVGSAASGYRGTYYGRLTNLRGLGVQKIDTETRRVLWSSVIDANLNMYYHSFAPVPAGDTVVVTAKQTRYNGPREVRILGDKTGQTVQTLSLFEGRARVIKPEDRYRLMAMGPPAIIDGRVCAELPAGITVYGPK